MRLALTRPCLLLTACIAGAATSLTSQAQESTPELKTITPVVLTNDGELAGCGLEANYDTSAGAFALTVLGLRDGGATRFKIEALRPEPEQSEGNIETLTLKTSTHDTARSFPQIRAGPGSAVSTSKQLERSDGARFIQGLMIGGGEVSIRLSSGTNLKLDLPGPMPQSVRASYLNCAGDLFRPEGASRARKDRGN